MDVCCSLAPLIGAVIVVVWIFGFTAVAIHHFTIGEDIRGVITLAAAALGLSVASIAITVRR